MKHIFERFRNKYKVKDIPIASEPNITKEEEAKQLTMKLHMLFVAIPVLKPCENDVNKVMLVEQHIQIMQDILNTDNELIKSHELYQEIKGILEEMLANNENGIEIDRTFLSKARRIKTFYYHFQDQKYWEDRAF